MITENYVSFAQAKKLKEKGFPQGEDSAFEVWNYYDAEGIMHNGADKTGHKPILCDAPYFSLVAKWLREEKDIFIHIDIFGENVKKYDFACANLSTNEHHHNTTGVMFDTYEQALSAGIDKALELF